MRIEMPRDGGISKVNALAIADCCLRSLRSLGELGARLQLAGDLPADQAAVASGVIRTEVSELPHESDQILLLLRSELDVQNEIEEFDRVLDCE